MIALQSIVYAFAIGMGATTLALSALIDRTYKLEINRSHKLLLQILSLLLLCDIMYLGYYWFNVYKLNWQWIIAILHWLIHMAQAALIYAIASFEWALIGDETRQQKKARYLIFCMGLAIALSIAHGVQGLSTLGQQYYMGLSLLVDTALFLQILMSIFRVFKARRHVKNPFLKKCITILLMATSTFVLGFFIDLYRDNFQVLQDLSPIRFYAIFYCIWCIIYSKHAYELLEKNIPKLNAEKTTATIKLAELTPREKEIVKLIAKGYSNTQIADTLFISPKTVKRHNQNIFEKVEVSSRMALLSKLNLDAFNIYPDLIEE